MPPYGFVMITCNDNIGFVLALIFKATEDVALSFGLLKWYITQLDLEKSQTLNLHNSFNFEVF